MATKLEKLGMILMIVVFSLCSCKGNKKRGEITKEAIEWEGKEILFPENVPCYIFGKDSLQEYCNDLFNKDFKILLYVDSAGCSSCRLKLLEWKQLIEETEILYPDKVGFLFYLQPKSMEEIKDGSSLSFEYQVANADEQIKLKTSTEDNRFYSVLSYQKEKSGWVDVSAIDIELQEVIDKKNMNIIIEKHAKMLGKEFDVPIVVRIAGC